jgi:hypothetical protein
LEVSKGLLVVKGDPVVNASRELRKGRLALDGRGPGLDSRMGEKTHEGKDPIRAKVSSHPKSAITTNGKILKSKAHYNSTKGQIKPLLKRLSNSVNALKPKIAAECFSIFLDVMRRATPGAAIAFARNVCSVVDNQRAKLDSTIRDREDQKEFASQRAEKIELDAREHRSLPPEEQDFGSL